MDWVTIWDAYKEIQGHAGYRGSCPHHLHQVLALSLGHEGSVPCPEWSRHYLFSLLQQSFKWLQCLGPKWNVAMLQPYVAAMPLNL